MKKIIFGLGATALACSLVACSSKAKVEDDGKIKGEIRYAFWDSAQEDYFKKCIEEFNKEYPDVTVKLEKSSWNEYWTKLEAAATGGSIADVFWLNGPNITKYAQGGVLLPIDEFLKDSTINKENYPEALVKLYNIDGKQYAIPKDFDTIGVYYNKEIFDNAGVPYPTNDWTWQDMEEIAKQLTKTDGSVYGITAQLRDQSGFYNTVFASGGYIISDDKKTSGYDKEETKQGIKLWRDLLEAGLSPSQAALEETGDYIQFLSGRIGMHWDGSWYINQVLTSDIKDKVGVVALPSINGKKATVIHGLGNCIANSSKNKEAAWKWVEFLASEKANLLSAETGAAIPAYKGTADKWVESHKEYDLGIFIDAAQNYSYPYPASKNTSEWNQYEASELKKVFNLEIGVEEAANNIAEKMNKVLSEE